VCSLSAARFRVDRDSFMNDHEGIEIIGDLFLRENLDQDDFNQLLRSLSNMKDCKSVKRFIKLDEDHNKLIFIVEIEISERSFKENFTRE